MKAGGAGESGMTDPDFKGFQLVRSEGLPGGLRLRVPSGYLPYRFAYRHLTMP